MDFIVDNIKLVIGVVVALLWIIGKIGETKKQQQEEQPWTPEDDEYRPEYDEYGDEPLPPPLPNERQASPPPMPQFIPVPGAELERQQVMQKKLRAIRDAKAAKAATAAAKKARSKAKAPALAVAAPASLKSRLRNRSELRRAIVMREILDPPVSLR